MIAEVSAAIEAAEALNQKLHYAYAFCGVKFRIVTVDINYVTCKTCIRIAKNDSAKKES
jgi:hypothetical protein